MVNSADFKQVLIEGLNLEDITVDEIEDDFPLFGDDGLGLDSVDAIELVLIIEKSYGIKIESSEEYNDIFASVNSLLKYVNSKNV